MTLAAQNPLRKAELMRAIRLVAVSAVFVGLASVAYPQTVLNRLGSMPAAGRDASGAAASDPACSGFVGESWGAVPLCDGAQNKVADTPQQYEQRRFTR